MKAYMLSRGREYSEYLEYFFTIGSGDQTRLNSWFWFDIGSVYGSDLGRIIMSEDPSVFICDQQIDNIWLPGSFSKQILKLTAAPVHPYPCSGPGLE